MYIQAQESLHYIINYTIKMVIMYIKPPEYTKSDEGCSFRMEDRMCCNALNYLRPNKCNSYCTPKLDSWLRKEYPEMDDDTVKEQVARLTEHNAK